MLNQLPIRFETMTMRRSAAEVWLAAKVFARWMRPLPGALSDESGGSPSPRGAILSDPSTGGVAMASTVRNAFSSGKAAARWPSCTISLPMLFGTQHINEKGRLEVGGVDSVELAERFGTP